MILPNTPNMTDSNVSLPALGSASEEDDWTFSMAIYENDAIEWLDRIIKYVAALLCMYYIPRCACFLCSLPQDLKKKSFFACVYIYLILLNFLLAFFHFVRCAYGHFAFDVIKFMKRDEENSLLNYLKWDAAVASLHRSIVPILMLLFVQQFAMNNSFRLSELLLSPVMAALFCGFATVSSLVSNFLPYFLLADDGDEQQLARLITLPRARPIEDIAFPMLLMVIYSRVQTKVSHDAGDEVISPIRAMFIVVLFTNATAALTLVATMCRLAGLESASVEYFVALYCPLLTVLVLRAIVTNKRCAMCAPRPAVIITQLPTASQTAKLELEIKQLAIPDPPPTPSPPPVLPLKINSIGVMPITIESDVV